MPDKKNVKSIPVKSSKEKIAANGGLWEKALTWTNEEWRHELVKLTPDEVGIVIGAADKLTDPLNWRQHLASAISGLNDKPHLEAAGKSLSLAQSEEVFTYINKDASILDKLPPLFVGMSHEVFFEILLNLTTDQLVLLKEAALTEAIQHHLSLVINALKIALEIHEREVYNLGKEISSLPLENIVCKDIDLMDSEIEKLIQKYLNSIKRANNALAIAWNTLRLDIIDELSSIKESFQRLIHHNIGSHRNAEHQATGLHAILDDRLNSIFIDTISSDHFKSLSDDTPAIEALVKLGIWYEQDYIDFGLIPEDYSEESKNESNQNRREKKYIKVNESLKSIGLNTLKDLKQSQIYSKRALQDFIEKALASH